MMRRPAFSIISSVALTSLALGLAALADNADLREQDSLSGVLPFQADALAHRTWADPRSQTELPTANQFPPQIEAVSSAPSTHSSIMATWEIVSDAKGYLLDVSASDSFSSFVDDYHDLDVGNVAGRVVTGLNPGTTYYYRVRPYYNTGQGSYSEAMTATTTPTSGLTINATFDSSITNHYNAAAIEATINRTISILESLYSDPITIQILFRYATTAPDGTPLGSGRIAQSNFVVYPIPWSTYLSALRADAKTDNDALANANLPGNVLSSNIRPSSAGGRAVGLNTPPAMFANGTVGIGAPYDGIVTLNSGAPYQFSRPPGAGNFDAQRSIEHEMDEVIGLGSLLSTAGTDLRPQDLFSWSSPGFRNITSSGSRYFSINGGVTNIVNFNQNSNGDFGDWLSTACPQAHPYVQNAFVCAGQSSDIAAGSPEGINLDVIGYDLANIPVVATNEATYTTSSSARLSGTIIPNGVATNAHFEYGTTANYESVTPSHSYGGSTTQTVTANITGLSANTAYHFRLVATHGNGTSYSSDKTFTTFGVTGFPVVITNEANVIASFSAMLHGFVYPHGSTTNVYFQYGTTTNYGSTTASQTKAGNTYGTVSSNISGVTASTTYHFRIVATNSAGTRYGSDNAFTTLSATGPPIVITNQATMIASHSATFNGSLDPHGLTTSIYFQYGTTTSYGHTTPAQSQIGNTYRNITANISGLRANTSFHFRIVATNSAGTVYGRGRTFTTLVPDESVAWQNNPAHDGSDPASPLVTPLTLRWRRDLQTGPFVHISYPLIAQGLVFITTTTNQGETLMALDEHTGMTVWSTHVGACCFANAAYDSGRVFVVNDNGLMKAFDAAAGTVLWSIRLPGQHSFTSPPTAANGIVFTGGAGSGGTVYAVNETNGAVLWTMPVENGDSSSPAVIPGRVFVSYACPQAYAFNTVTGEELWHHSSCCAGGGGKTAVVHAARVYVRDSFCTPATNGLVLNANTGAIIRGFNSDRPPAFFANLALFLQDGILRGVNAQNGQVLWSFAGDGGLTSAPLVVNQTIYIGSNSGTLYGLNRSGQQIWSTNVGAAIPTPDEHNVTVQTGLGAGDRLLIVPTESTLVAYGN